MTFSMMGLIQFSAKIADGRSTLADRLSVATNFKNGTTAGKADGYWTGTLTIAAGDDTNFDLTSLSFTALGLTGTVDFASVKYFAVVNQSANVPLTVGPEATNGWDQIGDTVVGKGGTLVIHSGIAGLPVSGTSKVVKVANNGTVTTLTGDTTTGSGSNVITGLSSTTGLAVGMTITGTGIPAGTTITAVGTTTVTMSEAATVASGSGGTSIDFAWPDAVVKVYVAGILD